MLKFKNTESTIEVGLDEKLNLKIKLRVNEKKFFF